MSQWPIVLPNDWRIHPMTSESAVRHVLKHYLNPRERWWQVSKYSQSELRSLSRTLHRKVAESERSDRAKALYRSGYEPAIHGVLDEALAGRSDYLLGVIGGQHVFAVSSPANIIVIARGQDGLRVRTAYRLRSADADRRTLRRRVTRRLRWAVSLLVDSESKGVDHA